MEAESPETTGVGRRGRLSRRWGANSILKSGRGGSEQSITTGRASAEPPGQSRTESPGRPSPASGARWDVGEHLSSREPLSLRKSEEAEGM